MAKPYNKTEKWWDTKYKSYQRMYFKTEAKQASYGLPMASALMDKNEFKHAYKAFQADMTAVQKKNKESVNKIIVKNQRYELDYTLKQQARIRKYASDQLEKAIDTGDPSHSLLGGQRDFVSQMYEDLKRQGLSNEAASEIISSDIFGSP